MTTTDDAKACGGCFVPPTENTVVTGHRMAMALSKDRTVLWDQIDYSGDPTEFSWVLPVKPGAILELAHNAFFQTLDAGTSTTVAQPNPNCFGSGDGFGSVGGGDDTFGCGCASENGAPSAGGNFAGDFNGPGDPPPPPDVQVVSQQTAGPYDVVTLSTDVPGALNTWLDDNGYAVPDEMQPIIDAYVADGFDFIALKLLPGVGVNRMAPVRVITQGASFTLPLRMVAAGTGAQTALSLFVIAEGRYEAANFGNVTVPQQDVLWDFNEQSSNYAELRLEQLQQDDGHVWLTSFAKRGVLLDHLSDPLFTPNMGNANPYVTYSGAGWAANTLADAYLELAAVDGVEEDVLECKMRLNAAAEMNGLVVDNCDDEGNCTPLNDSEISLSDFICGEIDDLGAALLGMHAEDVWVTRLDANLPREALIQDLELTAPMAQDRVENRFVADFDEEKACGPTPSSAALGGRKPARKLPGGLVALCLGGLAVGLMLRRRREQPLGEL